MTDWKTETARTVYERTYRREKPDGSLETWPETVRRVVAGNVALVEPRYIEEGEEDRLVELIESFKVLPAGRHLKSSGVNDHALNNCWAAGWYPEDPAEHFTFTLLRLAEGGGVGANYSNHYLAEFPAVVSPTTVHIVCDPDHPDYLEMVEAGLISTEYAYTWAGAYPVEDSREGWADALGDLIRTAHDPETRHQDRVYDVSRVRCKGAALRTFGGTASGPAPFAEMMIEVGKILTGALIWGSISGIDAMEIDHEIARCIVSGGVRRSARMSIMRWDDPQIDEFLACKADMARHWTTNISVEVDDDFISAVHQGHMGAQLVLRSLAEGALTNGEPGFWNSSTSAVGEVDGVYTTNPCGEALLLPGEPCCLGSVSLGAFVDRYGHVDTDGLLEAHRLITRYLIRATCAKVADPKSAAAIARYRRIGVGHLGFADFLAKSGIPYSEAADTWFIRRTLVELAEEVDEAAAKYASELRIPVPIKKRVIAPTGTTSKVAGASGEGIHAPFADYFLRRIRFSLVEPEEARKVAEYKAAGYSVEQCVYAANTAVVTIPTRDPLVSEVMDPSVIEHAGMLSLEDMLRVQALYQTYWADQAVSYTASVDPEKYTVDDVARVLLDFMPRLKGSTIFPELSRAQAPYERISREQYEAEAAALGIETEDTGFDEICASGACPI
ncbi:ribonucleoside-triphosphate reductase, adenosylcobalamin-dependent [Streptomyces sp. SID8381]|uniref:ribonucleoside-triphosphate reductase, adenosylcobalamin-dependent n=1 Tax=unclassified Streptomyces TaxID=2593676 RepID=UPI00038008C2|nr:MULTISPECIES: ribonucleoside-triphosphate reductase, adenosylcobalamin-dependent [unclassified Streptomyces]MYX26024.1 ribonucleoside-triphosphate reductase, adenosylcobalamin-dependent [Streptomyces sp. SID8381]